MTPRIGALFAGYGGLDLAVDQVLGGELAWVSEINPAASRILAHHWPDVPNLGDITKVDWSAVEPVDVITGGSPCQDLSHAGKRAGMKAGTRSGLWASMCDAIDIIRPRLVVWENVRGALSAEADSGLEPCAGCVGDGDDGPVLRALGRVLGDLADLGYDAAWTGLRAADVGAPHGRFRVFLTAWPAADAESGRRGEGWPEPEGLIGRPDAAERGAAFAHPDRLGRERPGQARDRWGGPAHDGQPDVTSPNRRRDLISNGITRGVLPLVDSDEVAQVTDGGGAERDGFHTHINPELPVPRNRAARNSDQIVTLLPTPAVNDMGAAYTPDQWDEWTARMKAAHGNGNGHGPSLAVEALRMLPTPMVGSTSPAAHGQVSGQWRDAMDRALADFGQYASAIARWESVLGRPAPPPTEPTGKGGAARLSPRFVEWLMGLPDGWVTGVPGVSRNDQLKALGNGVVPQQAAAAIRHLLDARGDHPQ